MPTEEMFHEWTENLHLIAANPTLTGWYHQLSTIVHDIYEKGWKDAVEFEANKRAGSSSPTESQR